MRAICRFLTVVSTISMSHLSFAATIDAKWQLSAQHSDVIPSSREVTSYKPSTIQKSIASNYQLDFETINEALLKERDKYQLSIPLPDGTLVNFVLIESKSTHAELSRKFPEIKTFKGYQVGSPNNSGRFDITPKGFHGMFRYEGQTIYIDPTDKSLNNYISYYAEKSIQLKEINQLKGAIAERKPPKELHDSSSHQEHTEFGSQLVNRASRLNDQVAIRTYRIAFTTTGEYTAFHGGTVESALAEVVTLVNRLNEVFERDLGVSLELVANNDLLIFTDGDTDPFENNDNDGEINTSVIDGIIGNSSYDIGHVLTTGGGGLAVLGSICMSAYKADGVTGSHSPVNDSFYIDYVAHELGHQFGASHSFNANEASCSGNRSANSAYEVGAGKTIMSYAGLCGGQNIQNFADPYFHSHSIDQMNRIISLSINSSCGIEATELNKVPQVNAGGDYVIPANTPFTLTGSATDDDQHPLSYSWQQFDLGNASKTASELVDDGTRPIFSVFNPVDTAERTLPRMSDVLKGTTTKGEYYPTTDRELNFRLIVRDGSGGVNSDDMVVNVVNTGEAFSLTSPQSSDIWDANKQTIVWQVAGTNEAPISCSNVDVVLAEDGAIFNRVLATGIPNTGSYELMLPNLVVEKARLQLRCSNNIFFAVNDGEFSISANQVPEITSQQAIFFEENSQLALTTQFFNFNNVQIEKIEVLPGENYSAVDGLITPQEGFSGELRVPVVAISEQGFESAIFNAVVHITPKDFTITGQNEITIEEGESVTLTIDMFSYESGNVSELIINEGSNYSFTDTTVTPNSSFTGVLTVSINVLNDSGVMSAPFDVTITVNARPVITPTPTNPSSSSSGGGALSFLSIALLLVWANRLLNRRKINQ